MLDICDTLGYATVQLGQLVHDAPVMVLPWEIMAHRLSPSLSTVNRPAVFPVTALPLDDSSHKTVMRRNATLPPSSSHTKPGDASCDSWWVHQDKAASSSQSTASQEKIFCPNTPFPIHHAVSPVARCSLVSSLLSPSFLNPLSLSSPDPPSGHPSSPLSPNPLHHQTSPNATLKIKTTDTVGDVTLGAGS